MSGDMSTAVHQRVRVLIPWYRPIAVGFSLLAMAAAAYFGFLLLADARFNWILGGDRQIYRDAALRWLGGGSWYTPDQLAGTYTIATGHVLYPPIALLWLAPAAFLPDPLWWAIPIVGVAAIVYHHQPAPWSWPVMALCLALPLTPRLSAAGNPVLWITLFAALGTIWRPAFALIVLKPSIFPFALLGVRNRGWWVTVAAFAIGSALFLPMTLDYVRILMNARGPMATILYSLHDVAMVSIPLIAWGASTRRRTMLKTSLGDTAAVSVP